MSLPYPQFVVCHDHAASSTCTQLRRGAIGSQIHSDAAGVDDPGCISGHGRVLVGPLGRTGPVHGSIQGSGFRVGPRERFREGGNPGHQIGAVAVWAVECIPCAAACACGKRAQAWKGGIQSHSHAQHMGLLGRGASLVALLPTTSEHQHRKEAPSKAVRADAKAQGAPVRRRRWGPDSHQILQRGVLRGCRHLEASRP